MATTSRTFRHRSLSGRRCVELLLASVPVVGLTPPHGGPGLGGCCTSRAHPSAGRTRRTTSAGASRSRPRLQASIPRPRHGSTSESNRTARLTWTTSHDPRSPDFVTRAYSLAATDDSTRFFATKTPAQTNLGVDIEPTTALAIAAVPRPSNAEVVVAHAGLPRSEHLQSKREWRDSVRRQQRTIDDAPVWIDIAVNTTLSLEGLLKPIIDGLDPVLGMDPSATLEFTANDDRVHWLRIHRQPHLPCPTVLAAGPMTLVTQPGRPLEYRGYRVSSDCESDQVLPYRGRMFPHTLDP